MNRIKEFREDLPSTAGSLVAFSVFTSICISVKINSFPPRATVRVTFVQKNTDPDERERFVQRIEGFYEHRRPDRRYRNNRSEQKFREVIWKH